MAEQQPLETGMRRNAPQGEDPKRPRSWRRWIVLLIAVLFFGIIFQEILFPFSGKEYVEISHGNHAHYVPKDRDPDVPIGNFPTRPPGPNERILPDGRIVLKE